ncbi:MAG: ECF transporter S component [Treponema sp.]|nr:ECF transporter S component [Treponema sp.]
MSTLTAIKKGESLSAKAQALATIIALAATVAVPQVFHWLGAVSGAGTAPGIAFSPMHLPVIIAGFLAGPIVGAAAGLLGPVLSSALSGMPSGIQLPLMMVELLGYGLAAGLLRNVKLPLIVNTLLAMLAGRVLRMLLCMALFYAFGKQNVLPFGIWTSIPKCLPGIALQLVLIPLVLYRVKNSNRD